MFCGKCGNQIPDDSIFCLKCGTKVEYVKSNNISEEKSCNDIKIQYCIDNNSKKAESVFKDDRNDQEVLEHKKIKKWNRKKMTLLIFFILIITILLVLAYKKSTSFKTANVSELNDVVKLYKQKLNEYNIKFKDIRYEKIPDEMSKELGYNCERYEMLIYLNKFPEKLSDNDLGYLFDGITDELREKYHDFYCYTKICIGSDTYTGSDSYIYKNHNQFKDIGIDYSSINYEDYDDSYNKSEAVTDDDELGTCWALAEDVVKSKLKSPSSAKFPFSYADEDVSITKSGNTYTVKAWVEAENSFGAKPRSNFTVTMTKNGSKFTEESCVID